MSPGGHQHPAWWLAATGLAGVLTVVASRSAQGIRAVVSWLCLSVLMVGSAVCHEVMASQGPLGSLTHEAATGRFVVHAEADARRLPMSGRGADERHLVLVTVTEVTARGQTTHIRTPAVVMGDRRWSAIEWRDRVELRGRLRPSERFGQARAVIVARGGPTHGEPRGVVMGIARYAREGLRKAASHLPRDARGLVPALVVGDTSNVNDDLDAHMAATGMTHLNAVSGSNVTIVLVAAVWVAGWLQADRRGRVVFAGLVLVGYVIVCRPEPSVIRAAVMGAVGVLGTSWGRPRAACPALGAAIAGLIAWDPWLSVSPGFALSSLATLGLALFARPWGVQFGRWLARGPFGPRGVRAGEILVIPVAAQALCLPVLVVLSGSISLVSIPANVLAEPLVAPATLVGMATMALAPFWGSGAQILVWGAGLPAQGIATIAHVASAVPGGSIPWPSGVLGASLAAAVVGAALCLRPASVRRGWGDLSAGVVAVALIGAVLLPVPNSRRVDARWRFAWCDVGQGDAGLVRTGEGRALVVDVGPGEGRSVTRCLRRHGVKSVDGVLLTHAHEDHAGGLEAVLGGWSVAAAWLTAATDPKEGAAPTSRGRSRGEEDVTPGVEKALSRRGIPLQRLSAGERLEVGDVVVEVLWPRRVITAGSVANNGSLVLDVSTPDLHALLLGDAEREAQAAVIPDVERQAARRPYDIVKVAHHGSANQAPRLYEAAAARSAVIGVGRGNPFGHPAERTMAMLAAAGAEVRRTDTAGDVTYFGGPSGPEAVTER